MPPRFSAYVEASKAVFAIFADMAPTVEAVSIDEAFLDVRGLERIGLGTPGEIAVRLRRRVRAEVGLPLSDATKNAWANPNHKPMEEYQIP